MKKSMVYGLATLGVAMGSPVHGDIIVFANNFLSTPVPVFLGTDSNGFDHYRVSTRILSNNGLLGLDSTDSNDIIDEIVVHGRSSGVYGALTLTIRKQTGVASSSLAGIAKIHMSNPGITDIDLRHLLIDGDVLAEIPSNAIQVSEIGQVNIGGNVYGHIIANSVAPDSDISGRNMNITVGGDLINARIYNNSGGIDFVVVAGSAFPDGASGCEIWASETIGLVDIAGSYTGRIGSNGNGFSGHPDVVQVLIGGDFTDTGSMEMNSLESLSVSGNFDANIALNLATESTSFYDISGSFASSASITLPSDGLAGQVIINSGDTSDIWAGGVLVDGTLLGEDYTVLSSELGGGAVGLAPFNFHQRTTAPPVGETRDCNPYQTELYDVTAVSPLKEVVISHYGPVYYDEEVPGLPFRVEFKPDYAPFPNTAAWVDRTDLFKMKTETTDGNNTIVWTNTKSGQVPRLRQIIIETDSDKNNHGFEAAGTWRIHLEDGYIKCDDVVGNPDVAWVSGLQAENCCNSDGTIYNWYTFRVRLEAESGAGLLQGGNGPEASDLSEWLINPYETNADGETNTQDFVDMASEYTGN